MKTYVEVFVTPDGERASVVTKTLLDMGMVSSIGEHDFVYNWKRDVDVDQVLEFVDKVQDKLKNTGVTLNFTTIR